MKKVIRLTESDLSRIIKRIINEDNYSSKKDFSFNKDILDGSVKEILNKYDACEWDSFEDYLEFIYMSVWADYLESNEPQKFLSNDGIVTFHKNLQRYIKREYHSDIERWYDQSLESCND
jgi:hypothetical protein